MAYPVADILAARGVPFVFVTGYEADTVDDRFSHVPILQKPIERQVLERLFRYRERRCGPPLRRRADAQGALAERSAADQARLSFIAVVAGSLRIEGTASRGAGS